MKKFKVRWQEDTVEYWHNTIEAETLEEAKKIVDDREATMFNGADIEESNVIESAYNITITEIGKPEVFLKNGEKIIDEQRFPEVVCDHCNSVTEDLGGGMTVDNNMVCPECFNVLSAEDKAEAFDINKSFQENGRNWRMKHYGDPDGFVIITSM